MEIGFCLAIVVTSSYDRRASYVGFLRGWQFNGLSRKVPRLVLH